MSTFTHVFQNAWAWLATVMFVQAILVTAIGELRVYRGWVTMFGRAFSLLRCKGEAGGRRRSYLERHDGIRIIYAVQIAVLVALVFIDSFVAETMPRLSLLGSILVLVAGWTAWWRLDFVFEVVRYITIGMIAAYNTVKAIVVLIATAIRNAVIAARTERAAEFAAKIEDENQAIYSAMAKAVSEIETPWCIFPIEARETEDGRHVINGWDLVRRFQMAAQISQENAAAEQAAAELVEISDN